MTTFRELLQLRDSTYEPNNRSSLDEWFSSVLDVPLDKLEVGDVARAVRQSLFLPEILPKAEAILRNNPLSGEDYDGQLISSIASLERGDINDALPSFLSICSYLAQIDKTDFDKQVLIDIEKIEKLSHS